jgi:hypothetical protein
MNPLIVLVLAQAPAPDPYPDLPPLADAYAFHRTFDTARQQWMRWRTHYCWLNELHGYDRDRERWFRITHAMPVPSAYLGEPERYDCDAAHDVWLAEAAYCLKAWDELDNALNPACTVEYRRGALQRLLLHLGAERYERGWMPMMLWEVKYPALPPMPVEPAGAN